MNDILAAIFGIVFIAFFIGVIAIVIYKLVSNLRQGPKRKQEVNPFSFPPGYEVPVRSRKKGFDESRLPVPVLYLGALLILLMFSWGSGLIASIIGSFLYIIILSPLVMGYAGGEIVKAAIQTAKTRKTYLVVLMSLLVTIVMYGTYHYGRYVALQVRTSFEVAPKFGAPFSDHGLRMGALLLNTAIKQQTGHDGFFGYLLYKAQHGLSIGKFYSSNRLNLGFTLTWAYWLLEFGIILWIAISMGKKEASVPVCEVCGSRIGRERHLGGTISANEPLLLDLIQRREFAELGKLIEENADVPSTELYIKRCEACEKGNSFVAIRRASKGSGGTLQFTDLQNVALQPTDMVVLSQYLPGK